MNILLVDDDHYVVEVLKQSLDWESLSMKEVYRANSVAEAKKILTDHTIHILVCDIEMPKEDGFALIRWIRDQQMQIKEIMLTSYAEFKYANQAINLNCFAYVLKPIDFQQLEEIIKNAVVEEQKLLDQKKVTRLWNQNKAERSQWFWKDCLAEGYEGREEEVTAKIEEYGLNYTSNSSFILACIEYIVEDQELRPEKIEKYLRYVLAKEYQQVYLNIEGFFYIDLNTFVIVLERKGLVDPQMYHVASNQTINKCEEELGLRISILLTYAHHLRSIVPASQKFSEISKKVVCKEGEVRSIHILTFWEPPYIQPNIKLWETLLLEGKKEVIKEELDRYLNMYDEYEVLTISNMNHFASDFLQLLIGFLYKRKKIRYDLDDPIFDIEHLHQYIRFYSKAKKFFMEMLEKVFQMTLEDQNEESVVTKILRYIDDNLDKELTRESLADLVFLNQDYMSKLFKKELGESVGAYISNRRVAVAAEHLINSTEPVNSIALMVGYDNFSYFSKVFKTATGYTPKEYRQLNTQMFK